MRTKTGGGGEGHADGRDLCGGIVKAVYGDDLRPRRARAVQNENGSTRSRIANTFAWPTRSRSMKMHGEGGGEAGGTPLIPSPMGRLRARSNRCINRTKEAAAQLNILAGRRYCTNRAVAWGRGGEGRGGMWTRKEEGRRGSDRLPIKPDVLPVPSP